MIDLRLTNNDITLTRGGDFALTQSMKELLKQRMIITFQAFTGEWFLNPEFGAFNRNILFNKLATKDLLDSYYKRQIINFPEVTGITSFTSFFDTRNRVYSFQFQVSTIEETAGFRINLIPPDVEVSYPYFPTELQAIGCTSGVDAETQNALYELINIDLPSTIPWF